MTKTTPSTTYLYFLRVFSILLVILLHCVNPYLTNAALFRRKNVVDLQRAEQHYARGRALLFYDERLSAAARPAHAGKSARFIKSACRAF